MSDFALLKTLGTRGKLEFTKKNEIEFSFVFSLWERFSHG